MTATVEVHDDPFSLDIKRCYLPMVVHDNCPQCGAPHTRDIREDYLSYPSTNKCCPIGMYCEACDRSWAVNIKFGFTAQVLP